MLSLNNYSEEIARLLENIHKSYHCSIMKKMADDNFTDFTFQQISVLKFIYNNPGINLNELSKKLKLAKSTVSGIVNRLELKKAIIKVRPADNQRVVNITIAQDMKDKIERIKELKNSYTKEKLGNVLEKDILEIIETLKKLEKIFVS